MNNELLTEKLQNLIEIIRGVPVDQMEQMIDNTNRTISDLFGSHFPKFEPLTRKLVSNSKLANFDYLKEMHWFQIDRPELIKYVRFFMNQIGINNRVYIFYEKSQERSEIQFEIVHFLECYGIIPEISTFDELFNEDRFQSFMEKIGLGFAIIILPEIFKETMVSYFYNIGYLTAKISEDRLLILSQTYNWINISDELPNSISFDNKLGWQNELEDKLQNFKYKNPSLDDFSIS